MKHKLLVCFVLFALVLATVGLAPAAAGSPTGKALVKIAQPGRDGLAAVEASGIPVYARLSSKGEAYLLAGAVPAEVGALRAAGLAVTVLDPDLRGASYYLAYLMPGQPRPDWQAYGRLLLDDGVQALLRATPRDAGRLVATGVELRAVTLTPKPLHPASIEGALPTDVTPDPLIQTMIDQITEPIVYSYTGGLSGEWPVEIGGQPYTITTRSTYSGEPIEKATQFTGEHLEALGLDVEYHQWDGATYPNVIGELPGLINPDDVFIIGGHLDDRPFAGPAPGADDNASGSIATLLAADIMTQYEWGCTLRFALWTGEEQGLLGSHAYAQRAYNQGENIVGYLNLDMIAWNSGGSSPDIDLHADSGLPETLVLAQLFADVVDAYGLNLIPEINPDGTGASDHASFWDFGYTAILGIEDFGDFNPYYHTVNDDMDNFEDWPYYVDFVKASVATFAHMTGCLIPSGTGYLDGTVTAASGGAPIPDATVTIDDGAGHSFETATDGSGYYTQTLMAGTYTVTAEAYGYLPAIAPGVAVITDTVTTQDFALETAPTYVVSGTVTEAGTGAPLFAQIEFEGSPVVVWSDPGTGFYQASLAEGAYTMHVSAAGHNPEDRPIVVDQDQTQNFVLDPLPCILLVDDDNDSPNVLPYYTAALDNLGYSYNVFDVGGSGGDGPDLAGLQGYEMVIWFSGDKYGNSAGPNGTDEANLAAYLDGGGRLFLSSQDYLYDFGLTSFGEDYLGIGTYTNDDGDASTKYGVSGDPIGDGLGPYPLSYPANFDDYGDIVNAGAGASVAFTSSAGGGNNLDVDRDGGDWQTVFFGTSWVTVHNGSAANGEEVLGRIVDWFGGCGPCEPVSDAEFDWTPLVPVVGEDVTFTGTASGTVPFAFAWAFGDGTTGSGYNVTHAYALAGDYTVVMTVTNGCGLDIASDMLTVEEPSCDPVTDASFGWTPLEPLVGQEVDFVGEASGTLPISFTWAFGDGNMGEGQAVAHTYTEADVYTVVMTATNCEESWMAATHAVTVSQAPVCTDVVNVDLARVTVGTIYTDTLVEFEADVAPDDASKPYSYTVDYDDGTVVAGDSSDDPLALAHTFVATGTYAVEVAVWNCEMEVPATDVVTVTVYEQGVCVDLAGITIQGETEGEPGVYTFTTSYEPVDASLPISYTWDNGDVESTSVRNLGVGPHTLMVTATNCAEALVTVTHTIVVSEPVPEFYIYLPFITKD